MDKADCSRTPKIEAKERVNNLGLSCDAPYGLAPLDHGRSDRNWNNDKVRMHKKILLFTYGLVPFTPFTFILSNVTEMVHMISSSV